MSVAMAEDFKTVRGKVYKDATITHVEADGIVLRTKTGISKVYFVELPREVQERFHYGTTARTEKAVAQDADKSQAASHVTTVVSEGGNFAEKFAQRVEKTLDERQAILQGKRTSTPGPAEKSVLREFNFHKGFLAGIGIIACVLFAIVWRRFK